MNLDELERYVLDEIESYRYEVPDDTFGQPLSRQEVEHLLATMREALVKPEWRGVEKRDTPDEAERVIPEVRRCILVAVDPDPDGYAELYYDPVEEDFVLAFGDPPRTFGVRGDAVGCFMAR